MSAPKGSHNARSWNEKRQKKTLKFIVDALASVNHAGVAFKNVSTLAEHIAPIVGQSAGNLTRNIKYRVLLHNYLVKQKGAVSLLDANHHGVSVLKAKVRVLQLDNSNLHAENERLRKYIHKHMNAVDPEQYESSDRSSISVTSDNSDIAFENTAHLLLSIIERIPGLEVDIEQGVIQDMSVRPGQRDISTKAKSKWFIDYVQVNTSTITV